MKLLKKDIKKIEAVAMAMAKEETKANKKAGILADCGFSFWNKSFTASPTEILKALYDGRYFTRAHSASKSGMSRKIVMGFVQGKRLHPICIPTLLRELGIGKNDRVHGGGRDMCFEIQYRLWNLLSSRDYKVMPRYESLI